MSPHGSISKREVACPGEVNKDGLRDEAKAVGPLVGDRERALHAMVKE
jgi:hypothetical protein